MLRLEMRARIAACRTQPNGGFKQPTETRTARFVAMLRFAARCGFDVQTTSIARGMTFSLVVATQSVRPPSRTGTMLELLSANAAVSGARAKRAFAAARAAPGRKVRRQ
jgi:hypothetical protein